MLTQLDSTEVLLDQDKSFETNTEALVREAQTGDHGAFEVLYRQNVDRVYAICVRICADAARAEELTQDVFVRVWKTLASFRGESSFSSWLYRLAVNVVLVDMRTNRRRKARFFSTDDPTSYETRGTTVPVGARMDIEQAITSLPVQARAIFVLHDIEGYRHEEIANQMGLAVGTTKAQLHRARKVLKEVLSI